MGIHPLVPPSVNASTMLGHHDLSFGLKEKKTQKSKCNDVHVFGSAQFYVNVPKNTEIFKKKKLFVEYIDTNRHNCCCCCAKRGNKLKCQRFSSSWNVGLSPPR